MTLRPVVVGCPGYAHELGSITRPQCVGRLKTDELDRLVAAGTIREIDREHVTSVLRKIVHVGLMASFNDVQRPALPC